MSYKRLSTSERNSILADFQAGKETPGYEVIPSKTTKGKYTVRRKKEETPAEPAPVTTPETETETVAETEDAGETVTDESYNPYTDDDNYIPSYKLNKNAMFREMQMQMNRMFIEQMKVLRQWQKQTIRKQDKIKTRTKRIHDILQTIPTDEVEEPEVKEEVKEEVEQEAPVQEETEVPLNTGYNYFDNDYQNPTPVNVTAPPPEPEPLPEKTYANEYEAEIDQLAGDVVGFRIPSRRDRFNMKNFPI